MTEINTFLQQLASDANKVDLFLFFDRLLYNNPNQLKF